MTRRAVTRRVSSRCAVAACAVVAVTLVRPTGADGQQPEPAPPAPDPEQVPVNPPPVPPALPHSPALEAQGRAEITTTEALAAQPATRAFGAEPYRDTTAAATAEAAQRRAAGCGLSNGRLAGIMLSITFTEAGPLASSTTAPSPMTLSRWDTQPVLYSFRSASTRYPRAFWHPGVGMWQFDHPWANTAAGRIDTRSAAALAADVIASRWCGWTSSTGPTRFAYTVRPWHGCTDETGAGNRCLGIFNHHFLARSASLADDGLVGFTLQSGVTRLGGARYSTCRRAGEASARSCLYVNPAAAQGSRGWAATSGLPTPLAAPFYVLTVGNREWRYWLRADTGYDRDIVATAVLGSNPRSTLTWSTGTGLCDLSAGRGECGLPGSELLTPALASFRPDRLDMFARASSGALTQRYRPAGAGWTRTIALGGALRSQPAAVSWSPGRLDLFVRGTDDALWHKWFDGHWSGWESLGGRLSSAPTSVSLGQGRLDVFVRGADNVLWAKSYRPGAAWSGWRALGGRLTSSPSATSWGSDHVSVVVRGAGSRLYERGWSTAGWSSWADLGGVASSPPVTFSAGAGVIDLVVRGSDEALWTKRYVAPRGWSGWTSLGGRFASGPGGTDVGQVVWIAGRSPNGQSYVTSRGGPSAAWSGWTSIGA